MIQLWKNSLMLENHRYIMLPFFVVELMHLYESLMAASVCLSTRQVCQYTCGIYFDFHLNFFNVIMQNGPASKIAERSCCSVYHCYHIGSSDGSLPKSMVWSISDQIYLFGDPLIIIILFFLQMSSLDFYKLFHEV